MKMISTRQLGALFGAVALLCALAPGWASAAPLMTYQGRLKESGLPVSGNKSVDILFCNCLSGVCAPACASSGAQGVAISSGLFRTTFTVPASVDLAVGAWFLEVNVGGAALSPREQLTYSPFAAYASTAIAVVAGAIDTSKLAADAVTGVKILNATIDTAKLNPTIQTQLSLAGTVAAGYIDSTKLAADAVTTVKMLDASVTTAKLAAGSVDTSKLAASVLAGIVQKIGDTMTGQLTNTSTITVQGNAFSVGGSTLVVVGGNVGIGTTNPGARLDVNVPLFGVVDALHIMGGVNPLLTMDAAGRIVFGAYNGGLGGNVIDLGNNQLGTTGDMLRINPATFNTPTALLNVMYGNVSQMIVKPTGSVGIGTTAPIATLEVSSTTAGGTTNPVLIVSTGSAASQRLVTVQGNGNVGIGTSSPGTKLHVSSGVLTVDGTGARISVAGTGSPHLLMNSTDGSGYGLQLSMSGALKGGLVVNSADTYVDSGAGAHLHVRADTGSGAGNLMLETGNTPRIFIMAAGNVGIGTTAPAAKLHVSGASIFEGDVAISTTFGGAHLRSSQPTNPAGSASSPGCGAGPTVAVAGTDMAGTVQINTGTAPGGLCNVTVNFVRPYATAPKSIVISPMGANAAGLNAYIQGPPTTAGFVIQASNAVGATVVYTWSYLVIE